MKILGKERDLLVWGVGIFVAIAVTALGWFLIEPIDFRSNATKYNEEYKEKNDAAKERMEPAAALMIKSLRTKSKQLARDPSKVTAQRNLDDFIMDAKREIDYCKRNDFKPSILEVFNIARISLEVFKEYRAYDIDYPTKVSDFCDRFEDTADEMEVKLEILLDERERLDR